MAKKRAESKRLAFSKSRLADLPIPEKGRVYYHDKGTRSLCFCVTAAGGKTFYLYKWGNGRPVRLPLGRFPQTTIDQARRRVKRLLADMGDGFDPQAARQEARREVTLGRLWDHWITYAKAHKKSWPEDERQYSKFLEPWAGRRLSAIGKADVQGLHARIGRDSGHYQANRVLALLSAMFAKADEIGWSGPNPCKGIRKFREKSRDRFLQPDELPAFFDSLFQEPETVRDFFMLALLTGVRKSNLMAMRWGQITTDGIWRIPDTKAGEPQRVALVRAALNILQARKETAGDSPWVFPAPSRSGHLVDVKRSWERIRQRAGIPDLRIHDLRRTLGSWEAATGASLPIIGKTLGHRTASATQVYARLDTGPIREAAGKAVAAMFAAGGLLEGPTQPKEGAKR